MEFPKIRPLSPIPIQHNGQPSYYLRDPMRLNGHTIMLPGFLGPMLALCDGTRNTKTIARVFMHHYGIELTTDDIQTFIQAFDECYLLENERTRQQMDEVRIQFRSAPFREAVSAGGVYPDSPAALSDFLNGHLEAASVEPSDRPAAGLLSPHIDYARGASTYAQIWKRAANSISRSDLFVIIGTDHYGGSNPISLTRQDYATPYGVLPTNQEVVDHLAGAIGETEAFAGELYHRTEHSIELPLVWLHHLTYPREVEVVPILCGQLEKAGEIITTVRRALEESTRGRNVFYVISGDLAHVGPAFGSPALSGKDKKAIASTDRRLLELIQQGDADGFLDEILDIDDANNVCGTYPLYLSMKAMGVVRAENLGYAQCRADENDTSIVSIAGALFHPPPNP